jgi:hypothetical protein
MEPAVRSPRIKSAITTRRARNDALWPPRLPKFPATSGVKPSCSTYRGVIRRSLLNSSSCATSHHARARRFSSTLARTLLCRVQDRFFDSPRLVASLSEIQCRRRGALDLCNVVFGFRSFHEIHAGMRNAIISCKYTGRSHQFHRGTRSTFAISVCETELASPSSQENGDITPGRSDNRAQVRCRSPPTNTIADFESSGLVAGHKLLFRPCCCQRRLA